MGDAHSGTPWGRCVDAFDAIMDHARDPDRHILLAAGSPTGYVNMHGACEHYLPQSSAKRVAGVWIFPSNSRLRVARIMTMDDLVAVSSRRFTLIASVAEPEAVHLLEPLLTAEGRIIPFLGHR
jgi:hypothetical protein